MKPLKPLIDPTSIEEAITLVEECQKVLEGVSRGLRGGGLAPEARKAFKMVIDAARKHGVENK